MIESNIFGFFRGPFTSFFDNSYCFIPPRRDEEPKGKALVNKCSH